VLAIHEIALFDGLDPAAMAEIVQAMIVRDYDTGQTIIDTEDTSQDLFCVLAGRLQVKRYSQSGQEVVYLDVGEGSVVGEFAAIDGQGRAADVVAGSPVRIARLRGEAFRQILLRHPRLGFNLSVHLVRKIRELSTRVFEFSVYPVPIRIRKVLLRLAEQTRATGGIRAIRPAPTHYELAAMTATHREAVTRELASLAAQGVLRTGRQTIDVLDMPRLIALAGPDDEIDMGGFS